MWVIGALSAVLLANETADRRIEPALDGAYRFPVAWQQRVEAKNEDGVVPGRERGDGWLELKIRGLLLLRSNGSARRAHVSARDGVVTLTGEVEAEEQRELVAGMVRNIEGVKEVRNELRVRPDAGGSTGSDGVNPGDRGAAAE